MKKAFFLLLILPVFFAGAQVKPDARTAKPWTYWWWMGSAVDEKEIHAQLQQMAGAGFGGVHIIPIYGAKGAENHYITFLSRRWTEVVAYTVRDAAKLNMGVDVTLGTGWPFGGPNVTAENAAKKWVLKNGLLETAPTGQQVKRAAPGGEGPVLDPFSAAAMQAYLKRFDSTLARMKAKPRAVYNDSYEVYGANWTAGFLPAFKKQNGYDLQTRLTDFLDTTDRPGPRAVRRDYQATLSYLLREGFTRSWTSWAHRNGFFTRNQAHGSPANILDLYALADIPETESFGSSRFNIPFLRVDEDYDTVRFGTPQPLAMKFASSPANILGKPLVSAETTTWLANHFKVSLSQIKPQVDELFTAGINHVFFHGTTYSPANIPWPGWLFYASTNYGPSSHNWPYLPLLNAYITRCQTRLQQSRPDNDLLVYFPVDDLWAKYAGPGSGVHMLEIHHARTWLLDTPFGKLCHSLLRDGYLFDYVSDSLLQRIRTDGHGRLITPGGQYRAMLVPHAGFLPKKTRDRLDELRRQGADIVCEATPEKAGKRSIRHEELARAGLAFIRKISAAGETEYFVTNLSGRFHQSWIQLSQSGTVEGYDPLHNKRFLPPQKNGRVWLKLEPGESCFLLVKKVPFPETAEKAWPGLPVFKALGGAWHVQAMEGMPAMQVSGTTTQLRSWTDLFAGAEYFWGKMRYTLRFQLPEKVGQKKHCINLGDVRDVAVVRLNGKLLDTLWCLPYRVAIPAGLLKKGANTLEITVANLSFNYMRLRDTRPPEWKIFHDANIVDIGYKPFSTAGSRAMPSGLLGPVRLGTY